MAIQQRQDLREDLRLRILARELQRGLHARQGVSDVVHHARHERDLLLALPRQRRRHLAQRRAERAKLARTARTDREVSAPAAVAPYGAVELPERPEDLAAGCEEETAQPRGEEQRGADSHDVRGLVEAASALDGRDDLVLVDAPQRVRGGEGAVERSAGLRDQLRVGEASRLCTLPLAKKGVDRRSGLVERLLLARAADVARRRPLGLADVVQQLGA